MVPQKSLTFNFQGVWRGENCDLACEYPDFHSANLVPCRVLGPVDSMVAEQHQPDGSGRQADGNS